MSERRLMERGAGVGPVQELLRARFGLTFGDHNRGDLERAVRKLGDRFPGLPETGLAERLADPLQGPPLLEWLVPELTIGETYFFRGPEQFSALRTRALPELLSSAGRKALRAWSAGCATGEEAYSLAVALAEAAGPRGLEVSVLGTDVNRQFLSRAEQAEYSEWSMRGVDAATRARAFESVAQGRLRVRPEFRRLVRFAPLNLARDLYPDPASGTAALDLVFCRNVFIYFEPALATALATRLASCLAEGGFLFFGPSDPVSAELPGLELVRCEGTRVFRRRPAAPRPSAPARTSPRPRPSRADAPPCRTRARGPLPVAPPPVASERERCREEARALADRGDTALALSQARRWLELEPDSPPACHLVAVLCAASGDEASALDCARRALCLDPAMVMVHVLMGELHAARGRGAEAQGFLREALGLLDQGRKPEALSGSDEISAEWLRRIIHERLEALEVRRGA